MAWLPGLVLVYVTGQVAVPAVGPVVLTAREAQLLMTLVPSEKDTVPPSGTGEIGRSVRYLLPHRRGIGRGPHGGCGTGLRLGHRLVKSARRGREEVGVAGVDRLDAMPRRDAQG